ncbi:MAG: Asp-tRNA(Asn)/Glu-tRNA(Gln) amidotransferase subunit GatC, partial [Candidatus Uhrbacteria bacterium]
MKLKEDEVKHIAELARLELSDNEVALYADQMTSILDYVDQLNELDLAENATQMAHAAGLTNVLRQDEVDQ